MHGYIFLLLVSEIRMKTSKWIATTNRDLRVELGIHFHGLNYMFAEDSETR